MTDWSVPATSFTWNVKLWWDEKYPDTFSVPLSTCIQNFTMIGWIVIAWKSNKQTSIRIYNINEDYTYEMYQFNYDNSMIFFFILSICFRSWQGWPTGTLYAATHDRVMGHNRTANETIYDIYWSFNLCDWDGIFKYVFVVNPYFL